MTEPKTWNYDQQIQYELARDTISSLRAILHRQSRVINDESKIELMNNRAREFHQEQQLFDGFDDDIVKDVITTYSALIREYHEMGTTEEEIAAKGLPEKFWTTKVDYGKYGNRYT